MVRWFGPVVLMVVWVVARISGSVVVVVVIAVVFFFFFNQSCGGGFLGVYFWIFRC